MCEINWGNIIQLFIAIGTISTAIVAIWGDWIKIKLIPPKLKIEFQNVRGELSFLRNGDKAIFYHFKVTNSRTWTIAKNCKVVLTTISKRLPNGEFQKQPLNSNPPFTWTPAEITPQTVDIAKEQIFDFGFLAENAIEFRLLINPNNVQALVSAGQVIRFSLQPVADNFIPKNNQLFEVCWNGNWSDNLDDMSSNLIIREISS